MKNISPRFLPPKEKNCLVTWREVKNLTQKELAVRAGLTRVAIARIENCNTIARKSTRKKIADALGIDVSDLDKKPGEATNISKGVVERGFVGQSTSALTKEKEKGLLVYEAYELIRKADSQQLKTILSYIRSILSK